MRTPIIDSEWTRIVEYPANHLNDFCLFLDRGGLWHAIGIMGDGTHESETRLFHSVSPELCGRYENREPLLTAAPELHPGGSKNLDPRKHAPFVVAHEDEYHLFYRRYPGTILRLRSADPFRWEGPENLLFEEADANAPCIVEYDGDYLMYYCQWLRIGGKDRSAILLRRSGDLVAWSAPEVVHVDTAEERAHSYLESPFVIQEEDGWYLFLRHRLHDARTLTTVYRSGHPYEFPSGDRAWFAELEGVHAPEFVRHDGAWHIARVSGPPHANPQAPQSGGWVEIARLAFR